MDIHCMKRCMRMFIHKVCIDALVLFSKASWLLKKNVTMLEIGVQEPRVDANTITDIKTNG